MIGVCRRVLAPFLATPSTGLKNFCPLSKAFVEWDSMFLKLKISKPADDENERDQAAEIVTTCRGRGLRKRGGVPLDLGDSALIDSSPRKKQKD